jgi:glycosyltransferase involved in cell wall biosynthesis
VEFHTVPLNQSLQIKKLLDTIRNLRLVIFDRFYAEEAYSFHIYNHSPDAVRVVDMQDMHSLRHGRQAIVNHNPDSWDCMTDALHYVPSYRDSLLLREIASLHRSDLTMVCSPFEHDLLTRVYKISASKLCMAPFWVPKTSGTKRGYGDRRDFVFIGGFRHPPNVDAVEQMARAVWPRIRQALPDAQLHVHGAHCPPNIQALHDPLSGFLVHGFVHSLEDALSDKRIMLAPLRFGAGIKGKIVDAWAFGLPVLTTSIGSEGMCLVDDEWGGIVSDSVDEFVNGAVRLYRQQELWDMATQRAETILNDKFGECKWSNVSHALKDAVRHRDDRRRDDHTGALLWHQTARSTEYFSRWIECKESKTPER